MNTTLKTILIVLLVLVVGGGLFFAGQMYGRWNSASFYGDSWMPMMNGRGAGYGPSMMGNGRGNGYGPMMGNGFGASNTQPLTIDEAKQAAQTYLDSLDVKGLVVDEVMIFDNNAYVVVKEEATGIGAFELLVDSGSNVAYPEHGPNMMWNLKYSGLNHEYMMGEDSGRMGGNGGMMNMMGDRGNMMSGWGSTTPEDVSAAMTVTSEQAIQYAQKYLDVNISGATAATTPIQFYGYYTIDFEKDGKVAGMLSVNGYSGQVFLHTWHGTFVEETEMK